MHTLTKNKLVAGLILTSLVLFSSGSIPRQAEAITLAQVNAVSNWVYVPEGTGDMDGNGWSAAVLMNKITGETQATPWRFKPALFSSGEFGTFGSPSYWTVDATSMTDEPGQIPGDIDHPPITAEDVRFRNICFVVRYSTEPLEQDRNTGQLYLSRVLLDPQWDAATVQTQCYNSAVAIATHNQQTWSGGDVMGDILTVGVMVGLGIGFGLTFGALFIDIGQSVLANATADLLPGGITQGSALTAANESAFLAQNISVVGDFGGLVVTAGTNVIPFNPASLLLSSVAIMDSSTITGQGVTGYVSDGQYSGESCSSAANCAGVAYWGTTVDNGGGVTSCVDSAGNIVPTTAPPAPATGCPVSVVRGPTACSVSPANPKVGETVTWSLAQSDVDAYISKDNYVYRSYFGDTALGSNYNKMDLLSTSRLDAGVTSVSKVYSSPGTQYATFFVLTDYTRTNDTVREDCSVTVAPVPVAGICGTANGQTLSAEPSANLLCGKGSPSIVYPEQNCLEFNDEMCVSLGPVIGWYWFCGPTADGVNQTASCGATYQSAAPCPATTDNNCRRLETDSGDSAGSCSTGYDGSCNYTCNNGTWSENSNSCTPHVTTPCEEIAILIQKMVVGLVVPPDLKYDIDKDGILEQEDAIAYLKLPPASPICLYDLTASISQSSESTTIGTPYTITWGSTPGVISCTVQKSLNDSEAWSIWPGQSPTGSVSGSGEENPTESGVQKWKNICTWPGDAVAESPIISHTVNPERFVCSIWLIGDLLCPATTKTCDDGSVIPIADTCPLPNVAPTAGAGPDRAVKFTTNSIVISGASESDSDGSIGSRLWTRTSGPTVPVFANQATLAPTFSNLAIGTYVFRLTVTDNGGLTGMDEMSVVVSPATVSALSITVDPTSYSVSIPRPYASATPPSTTVSATYTLTNGTFSNTRCQLLSETGSPFASYARCNGGMAVRAPASVGTYTYSIRAEKNGRTATSEPFTVTVGFEETTNLTSGPVDLDSDSGTLIEGNTLKFASSVENDSTVSTGISFSDNFTYRWGRSGAWRAINTIAQRALAAGVVRDEISTDFTLSQTGILQVQHCIDSNNSVNSWGDIAEANEGAADNCKTAEYVIGSVSSERFVCSIWLIGDLLCPATATTQTCADGSVIPIADTCPATTGTGTCSDSLLNGDETGIDSGGRCAYSDSGNCYDGIKNGDETGIDSGGRCAYSDSGNCYDGIKNRDETGIDSGGRCATTGTGTCSDGLRNGDETGIDSGGRCATTGTGTCSDGLRNGDETGIDSGGRCTATPAECFDSNGCGTNRGTFRSDGSCSASAPVCPSVSINSFTAEPTRSTSGNLFNLSWDSSGADGCSIVGTLNGVLENILGLGTDGTKQTKKLVSDPSAFSTYTLTCSNFENSASKSLQVQVLSPTIGEF